MMKPDNVKMKPDNIEMEQLIKDVLKNEGHTFEDDGTQLNEEEAKLLSVLVEISKEVKAHEDWFTSLDNTTYLNAGTNILKKLIDDASHYCIFECTKRSDKIDYDKVALKVVIKKALPYIIEESIMDLRLKIFSTIRNINSIVKNLERCRQELWGFDSIEPCVKLLNAAKKIAYKKILENAEQMNDPIILVSK